MFEMLDNGQVVAVEEVVTDFQKVIIKKFWGMLNRINIEIDKTQLKLGEEVTIYLYWQKFNTELGCYQDDQSNFEDFQVEVAGVQEVISPVNGVAQLIFSSDEPGEFTIRTANPNVDNTEIKVVVS